MKYTHETKAAHRDGITAGETPLAKSITPGLFETLVNPHPLRNILVPLIACLAFWAFILHLIIE